MQKPIAPVQKVPGGKLTLPNKANPSYTGIPGIANKMKGKSKPKGKPAGKMPRASDANLSYA
jgi:hypothetical protein